MKMSRINYGQMFRCRIADLLNREFGARNGHGNQLDGYWRAAWPVGEPFLVDSNDKRNEATVVWFPVITDNAKADVEGDWLNVVNKDRSVITTTYIGDKPLAEVEKKAEKFVGKNHIVFARWEKKGMPHEFLGVYSCTKKGDVRTFRRIADSIETSDWVRR